MATRIKEKRKRPVISFRPSMGKEWIVAELKNRARKERRRMNNYLENFFTDNLAK